MTRLRTMVRGLASLVSLTAITVGLPILLARWGTLPGAPSRDWWGHLGDNAVSDTTVFTALTVAAWLAWAAFTATAAIELVAGLRGIQAPRVAIAGPLQRSARTLVAGVLLLLSLANTPASYAAPLPVAGATTAQPVRVGLVVETTQLRTVEHLAPSTPVLPDVAETASAVPVVVVERGDNPWRLAEIHLGDGMRWRELYDLNCGVPQPDGRAWTDPELILPGWELQLPTTSAAPPTTEGPAEDALATVHVVVTGDTLSSIAEHYLGDPDRYPEVFDANRDVVQPDGRHLIDPNLIVVGWTLRIPTDTVQPPAAEPAVPTASPDTTPPPPTVEQAPPTTTPPTTASEAPTTAPSPTTTSTVTTAAPTATESAPGTDRTSPDSSPAGLYAGIAGAVALATAIALRFRWLHRRRATRGANLQPLVPGDAEVAAVAAADVPLIRWAAQQLAVLVQTLDGRDVTAAPVAVELSEASGIEILWNEPQHATPCGAWTVADGGWAWRLAYDPDAPLPADELPAGIPALVTIGQREGRQLLVDLEAFGTLALIGSAEHTDAFARSLALELACGIDLADAYVTTVGLALDPNLAPRHRLVERSTPDAIDAATHAARSVTSTLEHDRHPDTFRARLGSTTPIEATVIITTDATVAAPADEIRPRHGVAIVTTHHAATGGMAHVVIADDGTTARIEPLGIDFTPVGLPASAADAIASSIEALSALPTETDDAASAPAPVFVDVRGDKPAVATNGDQPAESVPNAAVEVASNGFHAVHVTDGDVPHNGTASPAAGPATTTSGVVETADRLFTLDELSCPDEVGLLVRVLGVPSIPERPELGRRELILAVMLACRGGKLAASAAQDALWGGKPVEPKTVWNVVTATRKAMGDLADGTPAMPPADRTHGTLRLDPRVRTDLDVLRHAVTQADDLPSSQAIAALAAALQLVDGPPFDAPGYDWAHRDQDVTDAARAIEAAVDRLVALAADTGHHDVARDAIRCGLRGLPGDEHLYRTRMRLEAQAGNMRGVAAAYDELIVYLQDIEAEPAPITTALYNDLRSAKRVTA